jgi:hypothetical protein
MVIKYDVDINKKSIKENLDRISNLIFKLLPIREEGKDWQAPLENLIIELTGMTRLLDNKELFSVLCKLEGLLTLTDKEDFLKYRKTIFECLSQLSKLKQCLD